MAEWNEADHPRDEDGKFTFKNGGVASSGGIVEGRVEKTDYPSDTDEGENGGG